MRLEGNTVFITGGGAGIGRGLAEAFHRLGNQVIVGGRRRENLEEVAAANPGMATLALDTRRPDSIRAAAEELGRRFPALNVVINNAGVQRVVDFSGGAPDENDIQDEIDTNIYGVLRVTSAFLPHLLKQPAAAIVNVSSGLAFVPMARYPVYCATKAFVHSFTMSLRHQMRGTPVRVIELAPPWVGTGLDAAHPPRPSREDGAQPMALDAFIAAAMEELASDREELPVAGAKFLYGAGVGERAGAVFEQLNR